MFSAGVPDIVEKLRQRWFYNKVIGWLAIATVGSFAFALFSFIEPMIGTSYSALTIALSFSVSTLVVFLVNKHK